MKKISILVIMVLLFVNFSMVLAAPDYEILPIDQEPIDVRPLPTINLSVQNKYECVNTNVTNVTYTAYTTGIPNGSQIDFYSGDPKLPYPTELIGYGKVENGKAYIKVFQKPDKFYIGSAVYTLPIDTYPPRRYYSNVVTYKVNYSTDPISIKVDIDNSCKTNVTYLAKLIEQPKAADVADFELSKVSPVKVRFLTFQIPSLLTVKKIDLNTMKPYRVDIGELTDGYAKVGLYLPPGKYIVYVDCETITLNNATSVFNIPQF